MDKLKKLSSFTVIFIMICSIGLGEEKPDLNNATDDLYLKVSKQENNLIETSTGMTWDGENWENSWQSLYSYDSNGLLEEEIETIWDSDQDSYINADKSRYSYNAADSIVCKIKYAWDREDKKWINDAMEVSQYNSNFKKISCVNQYWDTINVLHNRTQILFSYDDKQNKTEKLEQTWKNDAWENENRYRYFYDANNKMTESYHDYWQNDMWTDLHKYTFHYDQDGQITEKVSYNVINQDWKQSLKIVTSYNLDGIPIETLFLEWQNEAWVNIDQYSSIYQNGNILETFRKTWENEEWLNVIHTAFIFDTSNRAEEAIVQSWNGENWLNMIKILYTYYKVTSIEQEPISNSFTLSQNYPNPFNPETVIEYNLALSSFSSAKILIFNLTGQKVWSSSNLKPGVNCCRFNGTGFNSGIYYYALVIDGKINSTKKMILLK